MYDDDPGELAAHLRDAGEVAPARDGEQMGVWVYADGYNAWLYTASYHDYEPCYRRSETLARAYGVWCGVLRGEDGEWYPYAPREYTALLRERSGGDGLTCWQCGQAATELIHDAEHDISVPLCLDCRTGWTETIAAFVAFSEGMQRTMRLLTGRERSGGDGA